MALEIVRIYIPLLNEGVDVIRPTLGEKLEDYVFRIMPSDDYDEALEEWAFPPGKIVKCAKEIWEGNKVLVARNEYK